MPPRLANSMLIISCATIFCIIVVAGFSPFTSHPPNQVHWNKNAEGLYFGEYASIISDAPLSFTENGSCSVELWTQPRDISDSNTMLAFYVPSRDLQFSIDQLGNGVLVERRPARSTAPTKRHEIYLHNVLDQDVPILITVTAGARSTVVYINGLPVAASSQFDLTRSDLSGRIVIGNSPFSNYSWSGVLYGVAVYDHQLTADDAKANYTQWTQFGLPRDPGKEGAVALFKFDAGQGNVIQNEVAPQPVLNIPNSYFVLDPPFLEPFWRPGSSWGDWKDGLINFFGFVPLGLFLCPLCGRYIRPRAAILLTITLGFLLSFSIEATQYYLPTRDSDSRDLLTNSFGTVLGALVYGWPLVRRLLRRIGIACLDSHQAVPGCIPVPIAGKSVECS
jgi:VanZ family protein